MSFGVVLLCHEDFGRAAQAARVWAAGGCPVMVHVDARVPAADFDGFRAALADLPGLVFTPRFACEWGTWGLVAATLAGCERLLAAHPGLGHVYLASGACLPLRPGADLADHLARPPDTDFIESVTTADAGWTVAGLSEERFTLRFPFAWRRHRGLFDRAVALQRRLGLRRRLPLGIEPHLGSQWWCLTRATLQGILGDPRRAALERWFRHVWIPDESYFQTLARHHARQIESRSLTLSKFDFAGRPHLFHDDHAALLHQSGCFVARKIWPGAEALYARFPAPVPPGTVPDPARVHRIFARAEAERQRGRPGLYNQARFPRTDAENGKTPAPYAVLQGLPDLFPGLDGWLARATGLTVHGRLFGPDRVEFAGGAPGAPGGLCAAPDLRDHDPRAFLTNLLWGARGDRQAFAARPGDTAALDWFIATDPNARLFIVTGAWIVPLARSTGSFADLRREAARLRQAETAQLAILRSAHAKARLRLWPIEEVVAAPGPALAALIEDIGGPRATPSVQAALAPDLLPPLADLTGVPELLRRLRDSGLPPAVAEAALPGTIPSGMPA